VARPAAGHPPLICEQLFRLGLESLIIPLSQIDVADAARLSVVHTNHAFQDLRKLGVLSESRCIEVVDKKSLQELAAFDVRYLDSSASLPDGARASRSRRSAIRQAGDSVATRGAFAFKRSDGPQWTVLNEGHVQWFRGACGFDYRLDEGGDQPRRTKQLDRIGFAKNCPAEAFRSMPANPRNVARSQQKF